MAIPSGTRFGSYEIIHPIGAGGMGVVYRACDLRLGRSVAIKTLPPKCSRDPWRLRHFELEAKALSAINHPNIVSLYELGDLDDIYYMVMELVEGQTLRQHIAAETVKFHTVLDIGAQVASALSAAHSAGVVHRDIKPENVMIRPDGLVKVLDFGLAKLAQQASGSQPPPLNAEFFNQDTLVIGGDYPPLYDPYVTIPSATPRVSVPRMVLGTAPYMSPEQLRGREVDARTDIFSLGVMLYELVAGVVPFGGRTPAEAIEAVLEREPSPLIRYRPEVPRDLEHIINKALRKDRDSRYQHIKDLLIDLQDVKQEREFEAKLKQSAPYEAIDQAGALTGGQRECEIIEVGSIEGSQSIPRPTTSLHQMSLLKIISHKLEAAVTPVLPVGLGGPHRRKRQSVRDCRSAVPPGRDRIWLSRARLWPIGRPRRRVVCRW